MVHRGNRSLKSQFPHVPLASSSSQTSPSSPSGSDAAGPWASWWSAGDHQDRRFSRDHWVPTLGRPTVDEHETRACFFKEYKLALVSDAPSRHGSSLHPRYPSSIRPLLKTSTDCSLPNFNASQSLSWLQSQPPWLMEIMRSTINQVAATHHLPRPCV